MGSLSTCLLAFGLCVVCFCKKYNEGRQRKLYQLDVLPPLARPRKKRRQVPGGNTRINYEKVVYEFGSFRSIKNCTGDHTCTPLHAHLSCCCLCLSLAISPYTTQRQLEEAQLPALIPVENADLILQVHGFSERANWWASKYHRFGRKWQDALVIAL